MDHYASDPQSTITIKNEARIHLLESDVESTAIDGRAEPGPVQRRSFFFAIVTGLLAVLALGTVYFSGNLSVKPITQGRGQEALVPPPSESKNAERYLLSHWDFAVPPTRREYNWTISEEERNPDGVAKSTLLINGLSPGPLIECNEGDTIVVHVYNMASDATSIHWHGIFQNGSNWMDGASGITQCPIAPGKSFTYEFQVVGQSGTYLYRSEVDVQAADGLVGPIVIHSANERDSQKLDYDSDRVVLVQDYYHETSLNLLESYLGPSDKEDPPLPDSILINGKNIWNCAMSSKKCDNSKAVLETMNLDPGKNHRLRIVHVGVSAEFEIQIDNHSFAVTEVDGIDVWPEYYDRLQIQPTQRYSIVVNTDVTTADTFWFRVRMAVSCFATDDKYMVPEAGAIINYSGSPVSMQSNELRTREWIAITDIRCEDMDTSKLRPVIDVPVPEYSDEFVYLRSKTGKNAQQITRGSFNETVWQPDPSAPTLHRLMDGIASGNSSFSPRSSAGINEDAFDASRELVYQTSGVRTIDVLLDNHDERSHPLHLHGHKFWILAQGGGYVDENMLETVDLKNPLYRDTASLNPFSWMLIRFVADNPGVWALSSANLWDVEAGLSMQFLTRADELAKTHLPEHHMDLCADV